jgi:environmental stress-induced protein Ves
MPLIIRNTNDYAPMPWRNGLGTTVELAREHGPGEAGFLWRLSRADVVESGPFSNFPGIDRTLLLLSGAGFTLGFRGGEVVLDKRYQIARFPGDERTECRLADGPCKDFNIMVDRTRVKAAVALCDAQFCSQAASRTLLHVFEGEWVLDFDGDKTEMAGDSLVMLTGESGKDYEVRGSGFLLRINVEFS